MNTIPNPIGILAVDDHAIFRQGIISLLTDQPDMKLVAQAASGLEAIQQFRVHRPDITLMDLQMPEMNGLDAIIAIRGEFPDAKIIVLTTYGGDVQVLRALKAGARGYLLKNTLHKNLLDTIRAVHSGKKSLSPEASYELAEHATDDALTPGEVAGPSADCSRKCKQADRRSAVNHRRNGKGPGQKHPLQAECQRSDPCSHDRPQAGNYRTLRDSK